MPDVLTFVYTLTHIMSVKRIVVFGATGGTGRALVEHALDRGHRVTAFVRDPDRLPLLHHARLQKIQGDVLKPQTLPSALLGQEAVLCALGRRPFVNDPVCSLGTKHIMEAMAQQSIRSIVVETSVGVGESLAQCSGFQKFLFRTVLRSYFADKALQEEYVRQSAFDWTIVRPVALTNGPATDSLRADPGVQFHGFQAPSVSRADVACFMLDQLDHPTFLRQCPILY